MTDNTRRTLHDQFSKSDAYRSPNRILQTKYAESFSHFMEQVQYHTPLKSGRFMLGTVTVYVLTVTLINVFFYFLPRT